MLAASDDRQSSRSNAHVRQTTHVESAHMKSYRTINLRISNRIAAVACAAAFVGWAAVVHALPIITAVEEIGGDTDRPSAKFTGQTFDIENPFGTVLVANYTVPLFGEDTKTMTDRTHEYNSISATLPLPSYLVGGEYIMIANNNRDNNPFQLNITVSEPCFVYLLIDNRRSDGANGDPPFAPYGDPEYWPDMMWVAAEGFAPVKTGLNRAANPDWPDEVGIDESADGSINQYSSVYFKSVEAGTFSIYEFGEGGRNMYGVVVKGLPTSINNPPVISDVKPANNTLFYNPAGGLSFKAATVAPNRLDPQNIKVTLNGIDVSAQLAIGGTSTERTVSFTGLVKNISYLANISVSDQAGRTSTADIRFDTFDSAGVVVIEAEDYNYENGKFLATPTPAGYDGLAGTPDVDYHDGSTTAAGAYRTSDFVSLGTSGDVPREPFISTGTTDYQVTGFRSGDWMNYTRNINANTYNVFLRVANGSPQTIRVDRIVGDAIAPTQTLLPLGYFNVPSLPAYSYVPLTDVAGNPVAVSFSGTTTLRLTAGTSVNPNSQVNYVMLVPVSETRPPYVSNVSPAHNAFDVPLDVVVEATVINGSTTVAPQDVKLTFNGADVSGAATVALVGNGLTVRYDPPGLLALNTQYPARLSFTDSQGASFAVDWVFTTKPFAQVITSVVESGGDDSENTPAQFTGQTINHPNLGAITVASFREDVPAYRDRVHQWNGATPTLPIPSYLAGGDYIMIRNDNRDNNPFQLDVTLAEPALVYVLVDNRLNDGDGASPPDFSTGLMSWLIDEGWEPVRTGYNRLGLRHLPDEIGVDEGGEGVGPGVGIDNYSSVYVKRFPAGNVTLYQADNSGRNMYGVVVRAVATQTFAPEVAITSPAAGTKFATTPATIQITANASVENSTITKVEFFEGADNKIGEVTAAPYSVAWNNVMAGRYRLTAKATAANGQVAVSDPVEIMVGTVICVNFQDMTAEPPEGYLPDYGEIFADRGNGYSYGWDDDNTANARNRDNWRSPDERHDTLNHMQKALPAGRVWEIEVPNGRYRVHIVSGDPTATDSVYDVQVEGVTVVSGTPSATRYWVEGTAVVNVTDGRLTVSNGPTAVNNKICYIDVATPAGEVEPPKFGPVSLSGGKVTITWTGGGKLQETSDLPGGWVDVPGNPQGSYVVTPTEPRKFYRLLAQ